MAWTDPLGKKKQTNQTSPWINRKGKEKQSFNFLLNLIGKLLDKTTDAEQFCSRVLIKKRQNTWLDLVL